MMNGIYFYNSGVQKETTYFGDQCLRAHKEFYYDVVTLASDVVLCKFKTNAFLRVVRKIHTEMLMEDNLFLKSIPGFNRMNLFALEKLTKSFKRCRFTRK